MSDVNIPLLRKAVEWAEVEAAKTDGTCEWVQAFWSIAPDTAVQHHRRYRAARSENYCGTTYCIAGYICQVEGISDGPGTFGHLAADALGVAYSSFDDESAGSRLFNASNTIEDVRRIAEDIAGERL